MSLSRYLKCFLDVLSKKQKLKIEFLIKKKKSGLTFQRLSDHRKLSQ
jgi:hypothetical protein